MTASETPARRASPPIGDFLARYGIVLSFLILFLALALANKNFLTTVNILNVLRQVSINGILAIGMTFVILTGGIDLSIGSILAISGMVAGGLVTGEAASPPILAFLAAVATGSLFGA